MSCFEEDLSSMSTRMRAMRECYTIEYENNDQEDLSPKDCTAALQNIPIYYM